MAVSITNLNIRYSQYLKYHAYLLFSYSETSINLFKHKNLVLVYGIMRDEFEIGNLYVKDIFTIEAFVRFSIDLN